MAIHVAPIKSCSSSIQINQHEEGTSLQRLLIGAKHTQYFPYNIHPVRLCCVIDTGVWSLQYIPRIMYAVRHLWFVVYIPTRFRVTWLALRESFDCKKFSEIISCIMQEYITKTCFGESFIFHWLSRTNPERTILGWFFPAFCTHDGATGTCYFREAATGKAKTLRLFTVDYSQVKWPPPCEVDQPFPGNLPITGMVHNKK